MFTQAASGRLHMLMAIVLVAVLPQSGYAIVTTDAANPTDSLNLAITDPRFKPVMGIHVLSTTSPLYGSGEYIYTPGSSWDWLLTAGHNINSADISGIDVFTGAGIFDYDTKVVATGWYPFPTYTPGTPSGTGWDIGLIRCPLGSFPGITPLVVRDTPVPVGTNILICGEGRPGTPSGGILPRDGKKRAGDDNLLDYFGGHVPVAEAQPQYLFSEFLPPGDPDYKIGAVLPGPGDSGAAVLLDEPGLPQDGELVGTISYVRGGTFDYYSMTGAVALWEPEVQQFIAQTTMVTPEPGTLGLLITGMLMVGGRFVYRRRRR